MKIITIFIFLSASLFLNATENNEWSIKGNIRTELSTVDVQGKESVREGSHFTQNYNLRYEGPWEEGKAGMSLKARLTNDKNIDNDKIKFQSFNAFYKDKIWNLQAGDVSASLNSYVYGGALKGIKVSYKSPERKDTFDYTFISGIKKNLWKDVLTHQISEKPDRYSVGAGMTYRYERSKTITFSSSFSKDDLSTGSKRTTQIGKEGSAFGVESNWRFNRYVRLRARGAWAKTDEDIRDVNGSQIGTAFNIRLLTKPSRKIRSNFSVDRASSNFSSISGGGGRDKIRFTNGTTWRYSKQTNIRLSLKTTRDNLDGAKGATKHTIYEMLNFAYKPIFLKRSEMIFSMDNSKNYGRDPSSDNHTLNFGFNYNPKGAWRYGINLSQNNAYSENNLSSITKNISVKVGYRKKLSKTKRMRVALKLNQRRISETTNDQINYGVRIDTGITLSKQLQTALSFSSRESQKAVSNDTKNTTYRWTTTYKMGKKLKQTLRLLVEKKDYKVDNSDTSSYNENVMRIMYNYRF